MSADDSIEIEFPSLKQSAPHLVERVESKRAPGPIEAQLSASAGDDDLSWLSAIFADDEEEPVPEVDGAVAVNVDVPVDADAGSADPASSEAPDTSETSAVAWRDATNAEPPPMVPEGLLDSPPVDVSHEAADVFEGDPVEDDADIEDDAHDISPPPVRLYAEDETDDDAPDEYEPSVDTFADRDPIATETDQPEPPSPSKKVTGFREEIMSTFSQMYN